MSSQIIYSIDNSKEQFVIDLETNEQRTYNIKPEHEFDLVNSDLHNSDGRINKAGIESYNEQFIKKTKRLPPEKIRQFLHHHLKHHLAKGGKQDFFFQKLNDLVEYEQSFYLQDKPLIKDIILKWIENESKEFEEKIYYDTTFNEPESKYQCQIRVQDIKDNNLSYHDLIFNAFSFTYINIRIFPILNELEKFLEYQYIWYQYDKTQWLKYTGNIIKQYIGKNSGKYDFYHYHALDWISERKNIQYGNIKERNKLSGKIKWLGTPSQFGHILYELAEKGFIEMPKTHGEPSYNKYGQYLFEAFEIESTLNNIQKEINPNKNTLSDFNKNKFNIPNVGDLK